MLDALKCLIYLNIIMEGSSTECPNFTLPNSLLTGILHLWQNMTWRAQHCDAQGGITFSSEDKLDIIKVYESGAHFAGSLHCGLGSTIVNLIASRLKDPTNCSQTKQENILQFKVQVFIFLLTDCATAKNKPALTTETNCKPLRVISRVTARY